MNLTDNSFTNVTISNIVDIKQTAMAELMVLHQNNSDSCVAVFSKSMTKSSDNCIASSDVGGNDKLFLHDHKTLMIVLYGQSGIHYR